MGPWVGLGAASPSGDSEAAALPWEAAPPSSAGRQRHLAATAGAAPSSSSSSFSSLMSLGSLGSCGVGVGGRRSPRVLHMAVRAWAGIPALPVRRRCRCELSSAGSTQLNPGNGTSICCGASLTRPQSPCGGCVFLLVKELKLKLSRCGRCLYIRTGYHLDLVCSQVCGWIMLRIKCILVNRFKMTLTLRRIFKTVLFL